MVRFFFCVLEACTPYGAHSKLLLFLVLHVVWGKRMLPTRSVFVRWKACRGHVYWDCPLLLLSYMEGFLFATVRRGQVDGVFFLVDQPMSAPRRRRR